MIRFNLIPARPLAILAVALIALGAITFASPRDASAIVNDPTGVFCAHVIIAPGVEGIALVRMDLDFDVGPPANDAAFTAVFYTPRGGADCQNAGAANPSPLVPQTTARPIVFGTYDAGSNTFAGSVCQEDLEFVVVIPNWTEIGISFTFADPPNKTEDTVAFTLTQNVTPETCTGGDTPQVFAINQGKWLDGPDASVSTFDSDWDGDGCLDWHELAQFSIDDPFNPADCKDAGVVGGVAEIVDPAAAPLGAGASSSGTSAWLIAGVAAAAVAGATALGGAAMFARRRIDR